MNSENILLYVQENKKQQMKTDKSTKNELKEARKNANNFRAKSLVHETCLHFLLKNVTY